MMIQKNYILLISVFIFSIAYPEEYTPVTSRDIFKWPFSKTSIWNMPIGNNATYVHAYLEKPREYSMTVDEDYIVLTPEAPLMDIYFCNAGWDWDGDRCTKTGDFIYSLPIPQNFIVSKDTWDGKTPNAGIAVLMPDKRTIKQSQPFAHCTEGGYGTTQFCFEDQDIYGEGIYGAHGGSGLSSIGGTLRIGELTPTSGPIRHALKINLFGKKNIYYDNKTQGYRWPARKADSYAAGNYYTQRSNPEVKDCRMGALLALPPSLDPASLELETKPAIILAQALQDFGAYIVDDTGWDVNAIVTEWSPEGRFTQEFQKNWGFSFISGSNTPWGRDMEKIFENLHVVTNNSNTSVGGGGIPRAPLAPDYGASTTHSSLINNHIYIHISPDNQQIFIHGVTGNIFIYNIMGSLIKKASIEENGSLDIDRLVPGIYYIKTSQKTISFLKN